MNNSDLIKTNMGQLLKKGVVNTFTHVKIFYFMKNFRVAFQSCNFKVYNSCHKELHLICCGGPRHPSKCFYVVM